MGFDQGEGHTMRWTHWPTLWVIERRKVNWILDADIRGYFDSISRDWMIRFLEHRIGDRRVLRLITKWLRAGVLEEGRQIDAGRGTAQGSVISPMLANIYLHYVLDLWVTKKWRPQEARGDMIIVRYADDYVVGFEHRDDAERFLWELKERFRGFELELNADKTRLIEFGRYAASNRRAGGEGRPETFDAGCAAMWTAVIGAVCAGPRAVPLGN